MITSMIYIGAAAAVLATMACALFRAIQGPTAFDRILAGNMFGTKTVLLICVAGFLAGRPDFLDLALAYALINVVGTVCILKFFRYGDLGSTSVEELQEGRRDV